MDGFRDEGGGLPMWIETEWVPRPPLSQGGPPRAAMLTAVIEWDPDSDGSAPAPHEEDDGLDDARFAEMALARGGAWSPGRRAARIRYAVEISNPGCVVGAGVEGPFYDLSSASQRVGIRMSMWIQEEERARSRASWKDPPPPIPGPVPGRDRPFAARKS